MPLGYSPREDQILRLIALGRTDKQVAAALGISRKTVSTHLVRLYTRGGYHSRTEAVVSWMAASGSRS
ncbi:MAG TPA: LuxR C-terminal-related transcriptional regulator [Candidatus Limnocylindrales bacterium]|nr:LuxR C-terminal-related transcriptional regulator [Candidatus Limnocylindrales bacterium]